MSGPCFAQSAVARKKTARKKLTLELQGLRSTRNLTRFSFASRTETFLIIFKEMLLLTFCFSICRLV